MKLAVCLIGMAGSGKSTIGRELAGLLQLPFVDTDDVLSEMAQSSLQSVLDEQGLTAFLDLESRAVCSILPQRAVIATGGSVVYRESSMRHLASFSHVVHLNASALTIRERLQDVSQRGLARLPGQSVDELLAERFPLYRKYEELCAEVDGQSIKALAQMIHAWLLRQA